VGEEAAETLLQGRSKRQPLKEGPIEFILVFVGGDSAPQIVILGMRKHDFAILALLFMIGAVVGFIIAGLGFVAWMDTGFAIESKHSPYKPGLSSLAVFIIGLVAGFFCAAQAGILMKQSEGKDDKD